MDLDRATKTAIVYSDPWILIADKPSGLPTQSTRAGEPGLFELLRAEHPYVGLHHRLDRPASGLLVLARDPRANQGLARALREHRVQRLYRAILYGDLLQDARWEWPVEGKSALTEVRVLSRGSGFTAVELRLHTGRTHQIRRHAAMAGTPVAGDRRYGGEAGRAWSRLALHASSLALDHPVTGERVETRSELPPDLVQLWGLAGAQQ